MSAQYIKFESRCHLLSRQQDGLVALAAFAPLDGLVASHLVAVAVHALWLQKRAVLARYKGCVCNVTHFEHEVIPRKINDCCDRGNSDGIIGPTLNTRTQKQGCDSKCRNLKDKKLL
jgi:hypothetical protein